MLWGWVVGETKNIKWLRVWCGPIFVITAMLISAGTGAVATRIIFKRETRRNVSELLFSIEANILHGEQDRVLSEIRATDYTGHPDADDFDLLKHLPIMTDHLASKKTSVAERPKAERQ